MAELKDKIKKALDEGRILILGAQVLIGFECRSLFESGFEKLAHHSQLFKLGSLSLLLIAFLLLASPAAYHQIACRGRDTEECHTYTTKIMMVALLPFAVGFGIDMFVSIEKVMGLTFSIAAGLLTMLTALFFWYGLEALEIRHNEHHPEHAASQSSQSLRSREDNMLGKEDCKEELKTKIEHVLVEARMVLPGAQALLGFQFSIILMESFDKLEAGLKYLHLASLAAIALSTILLMTPAAYHRIVERGEDTEHFHHIASRLLLASMATLALGISGDFYVAIYKVLHSTTAALSVSIALLVFFYLFWFGFSIYRKHCLEADAHR